MAGSTERKLGKYNETLGLSLKPILVPSLVEKQVCSVAKSNSKFDHPIRSALRHMLNSEDVRIIPKDLEIVRDTCDKTKIFKSLRKPGSLSQSTSPLQL
ncbi:hypothetical protein CANMA_001575 [Candida margitis]|uniref:uncharacterized protein n=1 Tax=Candida margitis TaxID=1775924 RepID=UPI0022267444|nr:uncharacterized protein CANMA_001575 [Candida margitis]KAI5969507.1 hypothetical protein CANMA_001575 [Candida margitis]